MQTLLLDVHCKVRHIPGSMLARCIRSTSIRRKQLTISTLSVSVSGPCRTCSISRSQVLQSL